MKKVQDGQQPDDAPAVTKKPAKAARKVTVKKVSPVAADGSSAFAGVGELPFPAPASAGRGESDPAPSSSIAVEDVRSETDSGMSEAVLSGGHAASQTSGDDARQTWCFLTNRMNLLSILGMGAITRSDQAWRYVPDSRELAAGAIPIWRGAVPRNIVPLLEKAGADSPVILEFADELKHFIPDCPGVACVASGPIPFSVVTRVRFKDRKTLEDFQLKSFDDTPIIPEQLIEDSLGTVPGTAEFDFGVSAIPAKPDYRLDKVLGGLMAVTEGLGGRASACRFYCALVDSLVQELREAGSFVDSLAPELSDNRSSSQSPAIDGDLWLLGETLRFLNGVDPDVGLDPLVFVEQIEASLRAETGRTVAADLSLILAWCRYTKQLLSGNEEVRQLSDAKSIVQRAVLLFLIRPEQQRFKKIEGSSINPGSRVYLLASLFMGYFVGLQRIESPLKRTGRWYFKFVEHFITQQSRGRNAGGRTMLVQSRDGRGEFAVLHGEFELAKFEIGLSDSLLQVLHQVRRAGLQCQYDVIDQEICCSVSGEGAVEVKIGLVADPGYGETLRFYSECIRVSRSAERLGQLAVLLLERNAFPGIHGRFAIARGGKQIIYVQDQLLDTMDRSELETHIRHVADVGARFRTEFAAEV